jgi:ankyrin repeat protein
MDRNEEFLNAARRGDVAAVAELLDEHPELIGHRNGLGQSAVLLAQYHRRPEVVTLLIDRGAELNVFEAAAVGDSARLRQLVAADASLVHSFSGDGFTALMLAAYFGHAAIVDELLARGADVSAVSRNPMRLQALHSAAAGGHLAVVRALVCGGADVNARQQHGFTPLHAAAANGAAAMVSYLLERGADPDAASDGGQTPLDLALAQGHAEAAQLLA